MAKVDIDVAKETSIQEIITKLDSTGSVDGGAQRFTSNGTFIVPAGVTKIWITACGGGGSGSVGNVVQGCGGGGAAAILREPYSVTSGQSLSITIGSGGAAKSNYSSDGSTGGATVIGSLVTLAGGKGATKGPSRGAAGGIGGGYGGNSAEPAQDGVRGLGGGLCGGGGSLGNGSCDGNAGEYGGGGAAYSTQASSAGGRGFVLIEW